MPPTPHTYSPQAYSPLSVLPRVIEAVTEAGGMVAAEFARPDGPRFSDNVTAPLDTEIELLLRDRLLALVPARFVGEEFYPEFPTKAAVLGAHLVKNHPLKDGNVQVALVATVEFCARNGFRWSPPPRDDDGEETASVFLDLAAAPISESVIEKLSGWIAERIGLAYPNKATGSP